MTLYHSAKFGKIVATLFWKVSLQFPLARNDCFCKFFKLLLRWNCRDWAIDCVCPVSCRLVKIPRESIILSVFHKIQNGGKSCDLKLWVLRKIVPCNKWTIWAKLHDLSSNSTWDLPAQSLHFQLFAIVPPLASRPPIPAMALLAWPSTSVPDFTTFDGTVPWAAIDSSGEINNNNEKKRYKHNGRVCSFMNNHDHKYHLVIINSYNFKSWRFLHSHNVTNPCKLHTTIVENFLLHLQ